MKVAQLLSTIPDALPKEYAEKLQSLQAEAPSMGWFFVKRRMSSELGQIGYQNLILLIELLKMQLHLAKFIKQK